MQLLVYCFILSDFTIILLPMVSNEIGINRNRFKIEIKIRLTNALFER